MIFHAFHARKIDRLSSFSVGKQASTKRQSVSRKGDASESQARKLPALSPSLSLSSVPGMLLINWIRPTPDELYELSGSGLYFGPTLI